MGMAALGCEGHNINSVLATCIPSKGEGKGYYTQFDGISCPCALAQCEEEEMVVVMAPQQPAAHLLANQRLHDSISLVRVHTLIVIARVVVPAEVIAPPGLAPCTGPRRAGQLQLLQGHVWVRQKREDQLQDTQILRNGPSSTCAAWQHLHS